MEKEKIINNVKNFANDFFKDEITGHDNWHAIRVCRLARKINRTEKGDEFVIVISSLLHDIVDRKVKGHFTLADLEELLGVGFGVSKKETREILFVIKRVSFSSDQPKKKTLELKIVQDADRLDALGAIGIARTFAYGGKNNRKIYDPDIKPSLRLSKKKYKLAQSHSINHFYEKLLKLKDLMNTKTGKKIAIARHKFLSNYLKEFFGEWEGKK